MHGKLIYDVGFNTGQDTPFYLSQGHRVIAVEEATEQGLAYVFACAVEEHAQMFFDRLGFERVEPDSVPAAKWTGYDAKRRRKLGVFKRQLTES